MHLERGFRDRIQRFGGSVIVTGVGAINATAASGQAATMSANGGSLAVTAAGAVVSTLTTDGSTGSLSTNQFGISDLSTSGGRTALVSGRSRFDFLNSNLGSYATVYTGSLVMPTGTLTVQGTGTHTFSGPIAVIRGADSSWFIGQNSGAAKLRIWQESNSDASFYVATGSAGSETYTEAMRLLNASGYVQVASRLGIAVTPSHALHVAGQTYITSYTGIGNSPSSGSTLRVTTSVGTDTLTTFTQTAASATAPVLTVKLGATPSTGGHAQVWQDSSSVSMAVVTTKGIGTDATEFHLNNYSTSGTAAIRTSRARGTSLSPSAVQADDVLMALHAQGYNSSAFTTERASITMAASENWTTGANGTYITFATTPNGSQTPANRMRLDHTGIFYVGDNLVSNMSLDSLSMPIRVVNSLSNAAIQVGVNGPSSNNQRAALYVDNTNSRWGLTGSYSTGNMNFSLRWANAEILGYTAASSAWTATGNWSFTGTGTHTFSGPVRVTNGATSPGFIFNWDSASGSPGVIRATRQSASKFQVSLATNDDVQFYAATGSAGSETYTEALRIINSSAYVQVASRLGIGVSPSYPLDVSGNTRLNGYVGINAGPTGSSRLYISHGVGATGPAIHAVISEPTQSSVLFNQAGSSATAPVAIVRQGATPASGGDGLQVQDNNNAIWASLYRPDASASVVGFSRSTSWSAALFQQTQASATVPVVKIQLGDTPGAGGDALHVQNYSNTVIASISSGGVIASRTAAFGGFMSGLSNGNIVQIRGGTSQSGDLTQWQNNSGTVLTKFDSGGNIWTINKTIGIRNSADSANVFLLQATGIMRWYDASVFQTTVGAAGGASALPATPTKYLKIVDETGTTLVVPAYAAA